MYVRCSCLRVKCPHVCGTSYWTWISFVTAHKILLSFSKQNQIHRGMKIIQICVIRESNEFTKKPTCLILSLSPSKNITCFVFCDVREAIFMMTALQFTCFVAAATRIHESQERSKRKPPTN